MIFDGDQDKIGPYIRELADLCGLRDWTINILDDPPANPGHAACVDVRYGRRWVNVSFHPDWAQERPESFRSTCVHELLHCHLKPMEWAVNNVQDHLGVAVFSVFSHAYTDAEEMAIDAIATAWAESLPLPIMSKKARKKKDR